MTTLSFLDLVNRCNNFHLPANHGSVDPTTSTHGDYVVPWSLSQSPDSPVIGLLKPEVIDLLLQEPEGVFDIPQRATPGSRYRISFHPSIDTPSKRTDAMGRLCKRWRDSDTIFQDTIGPRKWRNEMYPVYRNPFGVHLNDTNNYLFEMERSACSLFGVATYGVHMTIYHEDADGSNLRIWTPTRSRKKQTYVFVCFSMPLVIHAHHSGGQGTWTTVSQAEYPAEWPLLKLLSRNQWRKQASRKTS